MSEMDQSYSPDLKQFIDEYLESLIRDLPSEQDLAAIHILSARFKRRMQRLVYKARRMENKRNREQAQLIRPERRTHMGYRKRLAILVIIITIMVSAFSISASREAIVGFVVQVYEKFSTIIFSYTPTATGQSSIPVDPGKITDRLPTDLPNGYVLYEQTNLSGFVQVIYTNKAEEKLFYIKQKKDGVRIDFDSEGIQTESIMFNQYQGIFFSNKGYSGLIWEDAIYAHSIIGKITKEEMTNMAKSTK